MMLVGSALAALLVWSGLLVGPPPLPIGPESVPSAPPTAEQPDAPAAPVPAEPAEPTQPLPEAPEPIEAPEAPEPIVASLAPAPAVADLERAPRLDADTDERWVKVRPPRWRGTGLLVTSGVLYAAAVAFQAGDSLTCGDCATGLTEHALFFTAIGMAAGGAVRRGHADAYDDTAFGRPRIDTRRTFIAGVTLTGAGLAMGLVNEGMWWRCFFSGDGPYADADHRIGLAACRYGVSRALLDVSVASAATGLGLLSWSLTYRRDSKAYQRARVIGLRPTLGRDRWGIGLGGSF